MKINHQPLCTRIQYTFTNVSLLQQALTHRSVTAKNNERLEFLGDAILNMVISQELYARCPHFNEGELSRLRAALVKGDMLANIAHELDLGSHLYLGQGELKSGGFRRASILADALEALFAAIYLDSGFVASQQVILHIFAHRLSDIHLNQAVKDSKTALQEYLQRHKKALPEYELMDVHGEEHEQCFVVRCQIAGMQTQGQGETRRKAEQDAAKQLLQRLIEHEQH